MNIVCKYKKPASVSPSSAGGVDAGDDPVDVDEGWAKETPLEMFCRTVSLMPSSSVSCKGVLKHLRWNSLSSVASRTPSLLTSQSLKIRLSASTHAGFRHYRPKRGITYASSAKVKRERKDYLRVL